MLRMTDSAGGVWVYTTNPAYNAPRSAGYAAFLTAAQQARLERLRQARMLFDGRHRGYFLEEARSQFKFPQMQVTGGRIIRPYIPFNVLRLVCRKTADLLFGQEPLLRAEDAVQQRKLAELVDRSSLHTLFYNTAVECAYEGEAYLEAVVVEGRVYVERVPADEIFPVGRMRADGQYGAYIRYAMHNAGTDASPVWLLLETVYRAGAIERTLWQLDEAGRKGRAVDLSHWPGERALEPATATGIRANTITFVAGEVVRDQAVSRIDGLIELQDELNAKQTQIGRVLAKHADPRLALPEEIFDSEGNLPADHDVLVYRDKLPTYVTWNAELEAASRDRAFTLNALLIAAEMSPALLGLKEGAAPDAARKLRLEATNALSMARRLAANWKKGIRRAVSVAQDLENTLPGQRYPRGPIAAEMRDGIPNDELDQARTIATLRGAGVMSRRRALEQQLIDASAVSKELGELDAAGG